MQTRVPVGKVARSGERGVVAVTVALLLVGLVGFGALAVDISSLLMVRNELQNAADAGALAGARRLYISSGEAINPGANAIAIAAAKANSAQNVQVETNGDPSTNTGDVQRGHWKWADHSFTPNASLAATVLHDVTNAELDADVDFINAVRVKVRRESVPASSFLARALGFGDFSMEAEAVGYIGFAGAFLPGESDGPIALCQEALTDAQGAYTCNTGRMINSNGGGSTFNTAGWTNYTQGPCETASSSTIAPYVGCSAIPGPEIILQETMGTTGGQHQTNFDSFMDCWEISADSNADGRPDTVTNMTLPVIECPGNNVGNCSLLVGGANVNMVWMIRSAQKNQTDWQPLEMSGAGITDWVCSHGGESSAGSLTKDQFNECWTEFVAHFNLVNYQDVSVSTLSDSDLAKTLFFVPDCDAHVPVGVTAGVNLGVLAKIPVLVN